MGAVCLNCGVCTHNLTVERTIVGQYFKFVNVLLNVVSDKPVKNNSNLTWQTKLDRGTDEQILENFTDVCGKNNWAIADTIAVGDYDDVVYWHDSSAVLTTLEYMVQEFPVLATVWSNDGN